MGKRSKRYEKSLKVYNPTTAYSLREAIKILKKFEPTKFDESAEMSFQLGVEADKTEVTVRGTAALPNGTGKKVRIMCFAQGETQKAAEAAGADFVGAEDYVQKIESGWLDFDAVVATPDLMRAISRLGKVLGPRGLMPTPKTGTVTQDVAKAIKEIKAGRVEFKGDKTGGLHVAFGKRSFTEEALYQNAKVIVKAILDAKPATSKGDYLRSVSVALSQSPGVRVKNSALSVVEE
ncbi:MAG: 50S ribosomal protein L1 [Omnitrophica bacterium RIFCSPLOWO2_12_FULL_44_17]|uniref:Large ribosomal subunit protein uL1 n=1 Tax=Candidatus Danuiimicrobium aquiferis TaxID=1801832 RepID=A0A1G1KU33_9BACT|nr:MAG: 50S ribosomal protein L1 [Omnitrophica bacterium RIFCSPHIGHO2_02_FULL_45_28]OGW92516.1 MAG: 50S ribosomal protein L1 [Omnitrophica bacterium RIFCSPHIGHO2_12_FULL_44_12]OGW96416.1 MAG: 50S ribosomal protein L1 [Omnitrophica bacterium RIFCSPLOWO2_12_FULL_44_17]OGX01981.1 MAG: 50S ribosomal protein L1 [Omnitrophica bacterium RIFCSPLOWO2_02_FULL_44_11]